jgi:hypothetical protein
MLARDAYTKGLATVSIHTKLVEEAIRHKYFPSTAVSKVFT